MAGGSSTNEDSGRRLLLSNITVKHTRSERTRRQVSRRDTDRVRERDRKRATDRQTDRQIGRAHV